MRHARSIGFAACLAMLAAFALRGGPGKLDVDPRWKDTKEPTHLVPSGRGLIEIWAPLDGKALPDEPVALLVEGRRLEISR